MTGGATTTAAGSGRTAGGVAACGALGGLGATQPGGGTKALPESVTRTGAEAVADGAGSGALGDGACATGTGALAGTVTDGAAGAATGAEATGAWATATGAASRAGTLVAVSAMEAAAGRVGGDQPGGGTNAFVASAVRDGVETSAAGADASTMPCGSVAEATAWVTA